MLTALKNILAAMTGILFCWIPLSMGTYDAARGGRGSLFECWRREWNRWWDTYLETRD